MCEVRFMSVLERGLLSGVACGEWPLLFMRGQNFHTSIQSDSSKLYGF